MRLSRYIPLFTIIALCLGLTACGSDSDDGNQTAPKVTGCSIAQGATVNPQETKEIILTFSDNITVINSKHALLKNITKGTNTPVTEGVTNSIQWAIPVNLDYDCEYSLLIVSTVAKSTITGLFAESFTLNFKTGPFTAPGIDTSKIQALVNPAATKEAKNVHNFLKSQYGKKILSGAMANVNNNNDFADWMMAVSGKYPAYTCYDFIHLPFAPANWIDYSDISAAKKQWNANGIVGYGWHWLVPDAEGSTNLSYEGNFDIDAALTPGTWQNKVVEADVAEVAGYLKLLQDENIPVLWRPLHEAIGDYKWGAWFWWGKQGPEKTKKLWYWLYDKLTNEYKLNNLIWVWTVQLYREGKLTSLKDLQDAYPGDEYVDIVGPDVYNDTHDASPDFFEIINALVGGRKLIAMPECGMLPDPDASIKSGADWSYCMLWYTNDQHKLGTSADDGFGNTPAYIKAWMNNDYILTREQMPSLK